MITNRHRGLVRIYGIAVVLVIVLFFWVYAEFIMRYVPVVRLSREVNLLPYFLCVGLGLLGASGQVRAVATRLTRLSAGEATGLASVQVGLVALAVFTMLFATQDHRISRLFLGTFLLWSWLGLVWMHQYLPRLLASMIFGRSDRVPTIFLGRTATLPLLADWLKQRINLGVQPVGFVRLNPGIIDAEHLVMPVLGGVEDLPRFLEEKAVGQVILMELPDKPETARQIITVCQAQGCRLLVQHQVEEILGHPVVSVDEGGHHFFTLHQEPLEEPINRALKRAFDVAVSLPVVLLVLPPLIVAVWLAQRLQSPGPLFYVRPRSGQRRANFPMLKFRSMDVVPLNLAAEGRQARADDPRIYPLGSFMRRHSLDEFPQFWNVLAGQMSIVGPRPVMPLLDEEFERQVVAYRSKHWVKPGITGLAQSEGFRGEIKTPDQLQERIRLDLYYIAHWSVGLDLQITAKTFLQIFVPPGSAY